MGMDQECAGVAVGDEVVGPYFHTPISQRVLSSGVHTGPRLHQHTVI